MKKLIFALVILIGLRGFSQTSYIRNTYTTNTQAAADAYVVSIAGSNPNAVTNTQAAVTLGNNLSLSSSSAGGYTLSIKTTGVNQNTNVVLSQPANLLFEDYLGNYISGTFSNVTATTFTGSGSGLTSINAGNMASGTVLTITNNSVVNAQFLGVLNGDLELVLQNTSSGNSASSSFYAVADNGSAGINGTNNMQMGINNSGYSQTPTYFGLTDDGYAFTTGSNLWVGTYRTNTSYIVSVANGGKLTNEIITPSGESLLIGQYTGNGAGLTNLPSSQWLFSGQGYGWAGPATMTGIGLTNVLTGANGTNVQLVFTSSGRYQVTFSAAIIETGATWANTATNFIYFCKTNTTLTYTGYTNADLVVASQSLSTIGRPMQQIQFTYTATAGDILQARFCLTNAVVSAGSVSIAEPIMTAQPLP